MGRRIEEIAGAYWAVGTALRHPNAPPMSCGEALDLLRAGDRLNPVAEEYKLLDNIHTLRFDIIEGNTQWRKASDKHVVSGSISILPIKR